MRILIIADIHANFFALSAALAAAPPHDTLVCLGDIVGYGAQPNQCCDELRERGALCILGNHDAAALGHEIGERFNAIARASTQWTQSILTPQNHAFLQSLPLHLCFEEWGIEAVHGSLVQPLEEYIQGIHSARPTWTRMNSDLCFFGHTHRAASLAELNAPGHRYETEVREWKNGGRFTPRGDGWKTLVNPGSIGQPRDGSPLARFALFDTQTREIELFAVEYDVDAARRSIAEAGLPSKLSDRLAVGL
jgi:diadenosine tetraphosphatase ApaH/serine/threonine PP2A family protein phosphatase